MTPKACGPWAAGILLAAFAAWAVVRALATEGFLEADEVGHFLYARHAPSRPMNLLHVWARPLYTTLLLPLAQLGLPAARLLSALSAVAAAGFACLACRAFGWRTAACAVPLTFVQPLFFQQTSGLWTEVTFSAFVGAWVLGVASARPKLVAAIAAVLPLVRPEGFIVGAATAIAALAGGLRDRSGRSARTMVIAVLPGGVVAWMLLAFLATGDPLWVPRHWPPNWAPSAAYGHGSWNWIAGVLPEVVPAVLLPLAALGCVAPGMRRGWPIVLVTALVLGVHAILWRVGAFGSAGYARYFVTLAPALAVLITGGVEMVARVLKPIPAAAWIVAVGGLALVLLVRHPVATLKPPLPPDARLFAELGRWIRAQDPEPVLFSSHPFAYLELESVPPDRFEDFGAIAPATLAAAPAGAWLLVEDRFYLVPRPSAETNGGAANPDDAELARLGFERVLVPDLGVDLAVADSRHDAAIERMQWRLFRKRPR